MYMYLKIALSSSINIDFSTHTHLSSPRTNYGVCITAYTVFYAAANEDLSCELTDSFTSVRS